MKSQNFNEYGTITDKESKDYGRTICSVFSRSMGFIRPISNFNIGKRQEFEDRKSFNAELCTNNYLKKNQILNII